MNEWGPGGWKIFERYEISEDRIQLFLGRKNYNGEVEIVQPAVFAKGQAALPWMEGSSTLLQAFLDFAWDRGLRPTGFTDAVRELSAVRHHLNDMRAIVGSELKVTLP